MSINNLAIHHSNRLTGQNSIAASCLARLDINRELLTAPGYIVKRDQSVKYSHADYRDINGENIRRKDLADQYELSGRQVLTIFKRTNGDYVEAHKQLAISSKHHKGRLGTGK